MIRAAYEGGNAASTKKEKEKWQKNIYRERTEKGQERKENGNAFFRTHGGGFSKDVFRKGKNAGAENSKESRKATHMLVGERYFPKRKTAKN